MMVSRLRLKLLSSQFLNLVCFAAIQLCAFCDAQIKVDVCRFGESTDLAIMDLNTESHKSLKFILSAEADACSVFSNTTAGNEFLASVSALPNGAVEKGSILKLPSPLRLGIRPLSEDVLKVNALPQELERFQSMEAIVGFVALRSIPFPVVIFDNKRGSVEFEDSAQPISIKHKFPLFSAPSGAYCVAVPIDGESWLHKLKSTGSADIEIGCSLLSKLTAMQEGGRKELFRLEDTPMKAKSKTRFGPENSFRIFGMDSDKVVIDKSAMILFLAE
ncbi:MAG: hypothetical protein ABI557_15250 [Aureliella sp.]